jgi:signal peptidase II
MRKSSFIGKMGLVAAITAAVLIADQASKALIGKFIAPYEAIEVIPGLFNVVSVRNPGAAFGIMSGGGSLVLTIISFLAMALIVVLIRQANNPSVVVVLSLILGGALGNIMDRIRFGEVVDFLDLHAWGYHWPAFNVADSAITIGVAAYLFITYFGATDGNTAPGPG